MLTFKASRFFSSAGRVGMCPWCDDKIDTLDRRLLICLLWLAQWLSKWQDAGDLLTLRYISLWVGSHVCKIALLVKETGIGTLLKRVSDVSFAPFYSKNDLWRGSVIVAKDMPLRLYWTRHKKSYVFKWLNGTFSSNSALGRFHFDEQEQVGGSGFSTLTRWPQMTLCSPDSCRIK